jgi:hypothetical protein
VRQVGRLTLDQQCSSLKLFSDEVLPEFKERELADRERKAERAARISEKAFARKPKNDQPEVEYSIPAAGRH